MVLLGVYPFQPEHLHYRLPVLPPHAQPLRLRLRGQTVADVLDPVHRRVHCHCGVVLPHVTLRVPQNQQVLPLQPAQEEGILPDHAGAVLHQTGDGVDLPCGVLRKPSDATTTAECELFFDVGVHHIDGVQPRQLRLQDSIHVRLPCGDQHDDPEHSDTAEVLLLHKRRNVRADVALYKK